MRKIFCPIYENVISYKEWYETLSWYLLKKEYIILYIDPNFIPELLKCHKKYLDCLHF